MIKSIHELLPSVEKLRKNGIVRGENTGFRLLDELYSIKQGTFTILLAEPQHGKSELILEFVMNQAERFGKRSLICSPETGSPAEVVAELFHKYSGKKMLISENNHADDRIFYDTIAWLNEWFYIIDTDIKSYSVPELFELAGKWEKENSKRLDIIVGEPYNELNHQEMQEKYGARQDLYIEDMMGDLRRRCKATKKHFFLSLHPSSSTAITTKDGKTYYPKPTPRQAAGGQALYRKAMTWITLWRPPVGLKDENGYEYTSNETHVHIDKAKPKGVSTRGWRKIFFDWDRNRFYEKIDFKHCYAFMHEKVTPGIQTELKTTEPKESVDQLPF